MANGFRCRCIASAIASAYDEGGFESPGATNTRAAIAITAPDICSRSAYLESCGSARQVACYRSPAAWRDALAASANPFSSSVFSVRASPRIKAVRDWLSFKRRSRPECRMPLHLSALRSAEFMEDIELERDVACLLAARPKGRLAHSRSYTTFRNLCSERRLSGRGLSLKVCGQLVHDTSPI